MSSELHEKLFVYGCLKPGELGFDHIKDKDYKKMLSEEERIFKSVNLKIK